MCEGCRELRNQLTFATNIIGAQTARIKELDENQRPMTVVQAARMYNTYDVKIREAIYKGHLASRRVGNRHELTKKALDSCVAQHGPFKKRK